jgi:hypothetical protein
MRVGEEDGAAFCRRGVGGAGNGWVGNGWGGDFFPGEGGGLKPAEARPTRGER